MLANCELKHVYGFTANLSLISDCSISVVLSVTSRPSITDRFIDLDSGQIDTEAQNLLIDLRDNKIARTLHKDNTYSDAIEWDTEGVNPNDFDHDR